MIASGPLLRNKFLPPRWKVLLAQVLSGLVPSLTVSTELGDSVPMSHDDAFLKSMPDQDLPHSRMSLRVGNDLLAIMDADRNVPAFTSVTRVTDLYRGEHQDTLPDLLAQWNHDIPVGHVRLTSPKLEL